MREINMQSSKSINIGYQGEYGATVVIFDVSDWYTQYGSTINFGIVHQRSEDTEPYVVNGAEELESEQKLRWVIDSVDTAYVGKGSAQIIATISSKDDESNEYVSMTAKSQVYTTNVSSSLGEDVGTITATVSSIKDIVSIKAEIDAIYQEAKAENSETASLKQEISNLYDNIVSQQTTIAKDVKDANDALAILKPEIESLQESTTSLDSKIKSAAETAAFDVSESLKSSVSSYVAQAKEYKDEIEGKLETIGEIEDFDEFSTNMEDRMTKMESSLTADESQIFDNAVKINKIEKQLNIASSYMGDWDSEDQTLSEQYTQMPLGATYGMIKDIQGQTYEFNQVMPDGNFIIDKDYTPWNLGGQGTATVANNSITFTIEATTDTTQSRTFNLYNDDLAKIYVGNTDIYFQKIEISTPGIGMYLDFHNMTDEYTGITTPNDTAWHTYYTFGSFSENGVDTCLLQISGIIKEKVNISFRNAMRVNVTKINTWLPDDKKITSAEDFFKYFKDAYYEHTRAFKKDIAYYDSKDSVPLDSSTGTLTEDTMPVDKKVYWIKNYDSEKNAYSAGRATFDSTSKKITAKFNSVSFDTSKFDYFEYYKNNTTKYCQIAKGGYGTGSSYSKFTESENKRGFCIILHGGLKYTFSATSAAGAIQFDTIMYNSTKNTSSTIDLSKVSTSTSRTYYVTLSKKTKEETFDNLKITITSNKVDSVSSDNYCILPESITKKEDYCTSNSEFKYSKVDLLNEIYINISQDASSIKKNLHVLSGDNKYEILDTNPFCFKNTPGYGKIVINYSNTSGDTSLSGSFLIPPTITIQYGIKTSLASTAKTALSL